MISTPDENAYGFDATVMATADIADETVASEIRLYGRMRLERGERITLTEFLDSVPNIESRPAPLDAAIDIALRSLSGSTHPTEDAVDRLIEAHPSLERAIRTAASLSRALWSSEAMPGGAELPTRVVPSPFGPAIDDGMPRYTLEELVGVGASGAVYRAVDRSLSAAGRTVMVAVKVLHATRTDALSRARFMEEASKARVLDHTNAVRVFDRGESRDGEQYIVYELVEGGDLHAWIAAHAGRVPAREAARMAEGIANAIQAAHSAGLVHLDLKPANVLVTSDGQPKVADFGLSVWGGKEGAADPDRSVGTLAFMPPEQFRGDPGWAAPRADVYALGGILYWMLTGSLPNGGTRTEIKRTLASTADAATRLSAEWKSSKPDRDLVAICARALAPVKGDRYATAGEFSADLCAWREHRPIRWMRPGVVRTMSLFARRRPAMAALAVVCAASMVGALVASEWARASAAARATAESVAETQTARADEVSKWRNMVTEDLEEVYARFRVSREKGFASEVLLSLRYLEMLYGRDFLDDPSVVARTIEEKIETVRALSMRADAVGGPDSMQSLQMRAMLGYMLAMTNRLDEAETVLAENEQRWKKILSPTDPWLGDIQLMRLTVHAGLELNRLGGVKPEGDERKALVDVERELRGHYDALENRADGSQLQRLILMRLREMYGPACLANVDWENWSVKTLRYLGVDVIEDRVVSADDAPDPSDSAR